MIHLIKKNVWLIILFVLVPSIKAQQNIEDYLLIAAENNPELQGLFKQYMADLEKVPQVGTLPDPTIAFGYFIQPIETRNGPQQAKISMTQMFPWFGTLSNKKKVVEMRAQSSYTLFEYAKSNLFYRVKSRYYESFYLDRALTISKENRNWLESIMELTQFNISTGKSSSVDNYRLEMELNRLDYQIAVLKDYRLKNQLKFNNLLNRDKDSSIIIPEKLEPILLLSKETLKDSVLNHNNELQSLDYLLKSLDYQKKVQQKEGMPSFSIGIEYAFIGEANNAMSSSGDDAVIFPKVGLSIPLYRRKYRAKIKEIAYQKDALKYKKQGIENKVIRLLDETWIDYKDASRRYEYYHHQIELVHKSLNILQKDYSTGKGDFEDLLLMYQKQLSYSIEAIKAESDRNTAQAFMLYLQGK